MSKEEDYTVVLVHYNQPDRIVMSYNAWMSQTIPPKAFIIVDDGSDCKLPDLPNICYLRTDHTENLSEKLNLGIQTVVTPLFVDCEPSLIPVGKYYAEKQLHRLEPNKRIIPMMIYAKQYEDIWKFGQSDIFRFGFGNENKIRSYTKFKEISEYWNTNIKLSKAVYGYDFWRPSGGTIGYKSDFLGYNEGYAGWGLYDLDYEFRWLTADKLVCGYEDHAIVHIEHPRIQSTFYEGGDQRNRLYYDFCLQYYNDHSITKIEDYHPIWDAFIEMKKKLSKRV